MRSVVWAFTSLLCLLSAQAARAALVTVGFDVTLDTANYPGTAVGSLIRGTFTYDTTAPDLFAGDPLLSQFAGVRLDITLPTETLIFDGSGYITLEQQPSYPHYFQVGASQPDDFANYAIIGIEFLDPLSLSLPVSVVELNELRRRDIGSHDFEAHLGGLTFGGYVGRFVPEPASASLVGAALAALAVWARVRTRL